MRGGEKGYRRERGGHKEISVDERVGNGRDAGERTERERMRGREGGSGEVGRKMNRG